MMCYTLSVSTRSWVCICLYICLTFPDVRLIVLRGVVSHTRALNNFKV